MLWWIFMACTGWKPSGEGEPSYYSCGDVEGATRRNRDGAYRYGDHAIVPCRTLVFSGAVVLPSGGPGKPGGVLVGSRTYFKLDSESEAKPDVWPNGSSGTYEKRAIVYKRDLDPTRSGVEILEKEPGTDIELPTLVDFLGAPPDTYVVTSDFYADMDGDGMEDLILYGPPASTTWLRGTADGLSTEPSATVVPFTTLPMGDLTGDGVTDLARFIREVRTVGDEEREVLLLAVQPMPVEGAIEDGSWDILLGTDLYDRTGGPDGSSALTALVRGGFDHNGDGIADVAVGNSFEGQSSGDHPVPGSVNIFDGPILESRSGEETDSLLSVHGVPCEEATAYLKCDEVGTSIKSAGDQNGDGYDDLLIANRSFYQDGRTNYKGELYVMNGPFDGPMDIRELSAARLEGGHSFASFPDMMQGGGDLDGDGLMDVLVAQISGREESGLYAHHGPIEGVRDWKEGTRICDTWGSSDCVAFNQDVDGDGIHDLVLQTGRSYYSLHFWYSSVSDEFPRPGSDCFDD